MYEVDQSGKVEETSCDTVVTIVSKKEKIAIRITGRSKRVLQEQFRVINKPGGYVVRTFAYLVAFGVSKLKR